MRILTRRRTRRSRASRKGLLTLSLAFLLLFNLYFFLAGLGLMGDCSRFLLENLRKSIQCCRSSHCRPDGGHSCNCARAVFIDIDINCRRPCRVWRDAREASHLCHYGSQHWHICDKHHRLSGPRKQPRGVSARLCGRDGARHVQHAMRRLFFLEWIVMAITKMSFLYHITYAMTSSIRGAEGGKFESPIAAIVKPLYKALLSVDKDKIKALSIGTPSNTTCLTKDGSVGGKPLVIADVNFKICGNNSIYAESLKQWEEKIVDGALTRVALSKE